MQFTSSQVDMLKNDGSLTISLENVYFIIAKAREIEPELAESDLDEQEAADLEGGEDDDAILMELVSTLRSLSEDEQIDLLALACLGGDAKGDWPVVRQEAAGARDERTIEFLLATPLLADLLEAGLSTLGYALPQDEQDEEEASETELEGPFAGDGDLQAPPL